MITRHLPLPRTAALLACIFSIAPELRAQTSTGEKATAETLFQSGIELIERGRVAEACAKFDASYRVEATLGTLFRLADCYDRIGRTASAWALFSEVKSRAEATDQPARAAMAAARVADLESRLFKLSLNVQRGSGPPGLELRMNDVVIPEASWGLELPVDPGLQRLQLSAPGHRTWSATVSIETQPGTLRVNVPELQREEPKLVPLKPAVPAPEPAPTPPYPSWLGYSVGGVGLVGLTIAGVFAFRAHDLDQKSLDHCSRENANACTPRGKQLRDDAQQVATLSSAFAVGGAVLLAGGVTLVLLRPSAREHSARVIRLSASVSKGATLARLQGEF
jgi:hypothetical protein